MRSVRLSVAIVAVVGAGCGKDPGPDPTPKATRLVVVSGDHQVGPVGGPLQTPLALKVVDGSGAGVAGVSVAFSVTAGGGSLTSASGVSASTGQVSTVWVLGGALGTDGQKVTATALGLAPATFSASGEVGPPFSLEVLSGNSQRGAMGAPLADSIRIVVKDQFGNPNAGVSIVWQVIAGAGQVSPPSTVTNGEGRSAAQFVLGSANAAENGNQLVVSVATSGVSSFVTASGDLTAGTITVASGDQQTGSPAAMLLSPIRVVVKAANGTPVQGVPVVWAVATGAGSLETTSIATDADGQVINRWTLGPAGGAQTVTASVQSLPGPPLTLSATALVPPAGVITGLVGEPSQFVAPPFSFATATGSVVSAIGGRSSGSGEPFRLPTRHRQGVSYSSSSVVVRFRPTALGATGLLRSTSLAVSMGQSMQTKLARLVPRGLIGSINVSPVILAARLQVRPGGNVDSLIKALAADPQIASAGREIILQSDAIGPVFPNDPLYPNQSWHYVMIDLPRAWAITTGSASVIVAVLDTGIRFDHPAFTGNLTTDGYDFVPPDSLAICAGGRFDNAGDGNGYDPDPTQPSDRSVENETTPCWGDLEQLGGHGLHTAGTVSAAGNDGVGGTGVSWRTKIRPVRVLGVGGSGRTFDIAQGILYASGLPASDGANGVLAPPATPARIINMSLGGSCDPNAPSEFHDAIQAATDAGVLVVVSAGNENSTAARVCPAGYPEPVTVAAVGPLGTKASYSNFGSPVDIAAPGGDLGPNRSDGTFFVHSALCDFRSNPCVPAYGRLAGTSMAAPHVSGVAALLLAQNPGLSVGQLRDRLLNFAVDIGAPGTDNLYGHGLLNARNSLTQTLAPARKSLVRLYNALTGGIVSTIPTSGGGSFTFTSIAPGDYWAFAGEDEENDGAVGAPGRRWTAFGGPMNPTVLRTTPAGGASAFFLLGDAREVEPNDNREAAGRLVVGGSVLGEIPAADPADFYRIEIPAAGTYTFETSGLGGAFCRFAFELNTKLTLQDSHGASLDSNDDIDPQEGGSLVGNRCSRIRRQLSPGTYFVVVQASGGTNPDNPGTHTGRYQLEVRAGQ